MAFLLANRENCLQLDLYRTNEFADLYTLRGWGEYYRIGYNVSQKASELEPFRHLWGIHKVGYLK